MSIDNLPHDSRIWIYGFNKKLDPSEAEIVNNRIQLFVDSWHVHNSQVEGGFKFLERQFVLLATNNTVSGCSIDSSVAVFKELKQNHGLDALDQNLIFFRNENNEIQAISRSEFQQLVTKGMISASTKVFNLMLNTIGQIKENMFETSFANSWHAKVFKLPQEVIQ